jgi:cytosine/adenosine deaminase-related metal-dependent hydrolase
LGRDDVGYLAAGMSADLIAFDLNDVAYAGALVDPVAATLFCAPTNVSYSVINGRVVVRDGHLTTIDLLGVVRRHNEFAAQLVRGDE